MADGCGPRCFSPVRSRPLRRQFHPIHRVVAVVVHDLRQAEVCDLDLAARRAVHQQDVACGRATAKKREKYLRFKPKRGTNRRAQRLESRRCGDPPGFRS